MMKKSYKNKFLLSFLLLPLMQCSFAAPLQENFSIKKIYPKTIDVTANQANESVYILRNNQDIPIKFKLETASKNIHLDSKFSTCNNYLPAGGLCKLAISFDAPKQPGQVSSFLKIISNKQTVKQELLFNVIPAVNKKSFTQDSKLNWQATSGPYGGQITDVEASPDNSKILYASAYGAGVYQSLDEGAHWSSITGDLNNRYVEKVVLTQNAIYALTYSAGIYKSIDQGVHWFAVNDGLPTNYVGDLVSYKNTLYSAMFGGIYQSSDGGLNWLPLGNFPQGISAQALLVEGDVIYVGTYNSGVYKSIDAGKTWVAINTGAMATADITSIIDKQGILYAGGPNYQGTGAVLKSSDAGQTWTVASKGLGPCGIYNFAVQGDAIYVSAFNASLNKAQAGGIYKTTDGGANWAAVDNGMTYLFALHVSATDSTLYAGTEGALYQSVNKGAAWNEIDNGIHGNWITSMTKTADSIFAGTVAGGIFRSTDNGSNWVAASNGTAINESLGISSLVSDSKGELFALSIGPGAYKSDNDGTNWSLLNLPTETPYTTRTVYPSALLATDTALYLGTDYYGVYYSSDQGSTWQSITNDDLNAMINSMAISDNILYASMSSDVVKIALSGNNNSWIDCKRINSGSISIHGILTNNHALYALTNKGIYVSNTQGQDWTSLSNNNGLPSDANVTSLIINGDSMTASSNNYGVLISSDAGKTWSTANAGLEQSTYVYDLLSDNYFIYAGTMDSVFRASLQS